MTGPTAPSVSPSLRRLDRVDALAMGLLLLVGVFQLVPDLAHDRISAWDESMHQVVTRHVFDDPLYPTLYDDPVHPLQDLRQWWGSNVWLLKPPGSFWFGALMMNFVGKVPLAFRIGGLLSQLIGALTIYVLARAVVPRAWGLIAGAGFLCLPLGWILTQARFVGDELDLMISGCTCVAIVCLLLAIEKDSMRWAIAAGAATGAGYLTKTFLAMTPLGIAGVLWFLSTRRFCAGPRMKLVVGMVAGLIVVAAPWNIYAASKWPDVYARAATHTLGFISEKSNEEGVPGWRRPVDAIFNEAMMGSYDPLPHALALLVGIWVAWRALRKRELVVIAAALWIWATWLGHSVAAVKIHAHLWNSVVAGFIGIAIVLADVWRSRRLAFAVTGATLTPWAITALPSFAKVRELVPAFLVQTRAIPGLVEGLVLILIGTAMGWALRLRPFERSGEYIRIAASFAATFLLCGVMLYKGNARVNEVAAEARPHNNTVYHREVGRAIDAAAPKKSIVMLDHEIHSPGQLEHFNLAFWSDRLVHTGRDPKDYPANGFHPYLVSPVAEPFAVLENVPASSWMRAYDLTVPAAPPPIPKDAHPLDVTTGNLKVLGVASGYSDRKHDHYAFFVRSDAVPEALTVSFVTADGIEKVSIAPEATLRSSGRLAGVPWFVLPAVGPPRSKVQALIFGADTRVALP